MKQWLANWGNYPSIETDFISAEFDKDLKSKLLLSTKLISRGNGRCYGDSALNKERVLSMLSYNKILFFDTRSGIITCQAGVLLSDILELCLPKGFFLPVTPGTKFITVGGAVAADVHGKNHHKEGCFSDHVIGMKVLLADGSIMDCSRNENRDLFWASCGGMGLSGIIIEVSFILKRIESAYIRQESIKCRNLSEIMRCFDDSENWTYTMSWIDCLQKGNSIGRSILMRGEHARIEELPEKHRQKPLHLPKGFHPLVPFQFPSFALNSFSVKAFNWLYWMKQPKKESKSIIPFEPFFYPLDRIHHWNRIYGKNGFTQYQFVIPPDQAEEGLRSILKKIADSGEGSFLAVLKYFGKDDPNSLLSFPMKGYTLALDFKISPSVFRLLDQLDEIVLKYNGRLYLAKDVRMTRLMMEKGYPRLNEFKAVLAKYDPQQKFSSIQSERISYNQYL